MLAIIQPAASNDGALDACGDKAGKLVHNLNCEDAMKIVSTPK